MSAFQEPLTDAERVSLARREVAQHAMQSGVAMDLRMTGAEDPKHLRVGVNTAMVDVGALASLLIAKGVFTRAEYFEACATMMEVERRRYEEMLSTRMGMPVGLG